MLRDEMPDALIERLGEAAADGLIEFLTAREEVMIDSIVQAVMVAITPRFDAIDRRFDAFDKRFVNVDKRFDGLEKRFDGVENRLDRVERRLDGADKRFDAIDRRFERFDAKVDAKLSRVVTIQVASLTLFATVIGAGFVALLVRL